MVWLLLPCSGKLGHGVQAGLLPRSVKGGLLPVSQPTANVTDGDLSTAVFSVYKGKV